MSRQKIELGEISATSASLDSLSASTGTFTTLNLTATTLSSDNSVVNKKILTSQVLNLDYFDKGGMNGDLRTQKNLIFVDPNGSGSAYTNLAMPSSGDAANYGKGICIGDDIYLFDCDTLGTLGLAPVQGSQTGIRFYKGKTDLSSAFTADSFETSGQLIYDSSVDGFGFSKRVEAPDFVTSSSSLKSLELRVAEIERVLASTQETVYIKNGLHCSVDTSVLVFHDRSPQYFTATASSHNYTIVPPTVSSDPEGHESDIVVEQYELLDSYYKIKYRVYPTVAASSNTCTYTVLVKGVH